MSSSPVDSVSVCHDAGGESLPCPAMFTVYSIRSDTQECRLTGGQGDVKKCLLHPEELEVERALPRTMRAYRHRGVKQSLEILTPC